MKGMTCFRAMFCLTTQEGIADHRMMVPSYGREALPSILDKSSAVVPVGFLPGEDATVTLNHHVQSNWGQGEVHICVENEGVITVHDPTSAAKLEFCKLPTVDGDVSSSFVVRLSPEEKTGDAEYEDDGGICRKSLPGTKDCDSDHPLTDGGSDLTITCEYPIPTGVLDNDSARYYEGSVNKTCKSSMERENSFTDLGMASGHASDPGVYRMKELESMCSSPLFVCGGQTAGKNKNEEMQLLKQASFCSPSESESVRHLDSISAASGHQVQRLSYESSSAGGEARDLSSGTRVGSGGRSRSEGAYQFESCYAMVKLDAVDPQKRKPWWKAFLVANRNIHRGVHGGVGSLSGPLNGYVSDVLNDGAYDSEKEHDLVQASDKGRTPISTHVEKSGCGSEVLEADHNAICCRRDEEPAADTQSSTMGQKWASFTEKTGLSRVEEWVSNVHTLPPSLDDDQMQSQIEQCPESPTAPAASFFGDFDGRDNGQASGTLTRDVFVDADTEMARMVARSVNPLSTVAHFSGLGLKVAPSLGMFGNLKTLNLSANSFVRIIPGCLPKSLHSLDISRNNIVVIEGLRELTRLRVLNLSFNRISRIGNGLSSCISLKEVHLAGNKVSEVEGLHRLSKLVVLDLSFNKITTTKSLGQIAANYKSLQALNLCGNALHSNLGDEQMRRFVVGLCPQLVYLNKQALKSVTNRDSLGMEHKVGGKNTSKPSKRGSGHQSSSNHRRTHSGGGGIVKAKAGGKAVVSPVLTGQGEVHHRKPHHHTRSYEKSSASKELPKGFVPLPATASTSYFEQRVRPTGVTERRATNGVVFREAYYLSPTTVSRGTVQAH